MTDDSGGYPECREGPGFYTDEPQGGPAFPVWHVRADGTKTHLHPGMSLRDYFAGEALRALLEATPNTYRIEATADAYRIADAMLKARKK